MNELWNAKTLKEYEQIILDKIVYRAYTPQQIGKVIKINHIDIKKEFNPYNVYVLVKWLKQTTRYPDKHTVERGTHLQDFETLVEDHFRKYNKHKALLKKAKKL